MQLDPRIRGSRRNRRGNSLIGPIDQALLDLDDIDRVDLEGRQRRDCVAQAQAADQDTVRATARQRELGEQAFGSGFAAVHGECAVDDQLFDIAAVPQPAA